mgnify:CR=1 FL=1
MNRLWLTLIILAGVAVAGSGTGWILSQQRRIAALDALREPRLRTYPDQNMLVAEMTGDPAKAAPATLGELFKSFYRLRHGRRDMRLAPPRARWAEEEKKSRAAWLGVLGLPLPASVYQLPGGDVGGVRVEIQVWSYGETAEMLHVGPYRTVSETAARLRAFAEARGRMLAGPLEEVYLRGPAWFGLGDPRRYRTLVRYAVRPAGGSLELETPSPQGSSPAAGRSGAHQAGPGSAPPLIEGSSEPPPSRP